jgi:hypothetical protein
VPRLRAGDDRAGRQLYIGMLFRRRGLMGRLRSELSKIRQATKRPKVLTGLAFAIPLLVIGSVWLPEFAHYYVRLEPLDHHAIEAARFSPAAPVLNEIGRYRVMSAWRDAAPKEQVIAEADGILRGRYRPDQAQVTFKWPLDPDDLDRGSSAWQFHFAAFVIPDRLLKAYLLTGNEIYFEKALEFVKTWHAYEASVWLPRGLLWNDHAVAERIYVLVDLWRMYRTHKNFDPRTAEQILNMVQRCTKLLAKPDHFTFATNHGVTQNLALMHAAISIPQLPSAKYYMQVARARIEKQFRFFLSPEGPVLEHSAFYHRFGLMLIGMFTRYMALAGEPLPDDWQSQYTRAVDFLSVLRRPDGSLPLLGDTYSDIDLSGPPIFPGKPPDLAAPLDTGTDWKPFDAFSIYPLSGYSVWWNGLSGWPDERHLSQLLITWSHFPGHGHQRAQDLSVLFWASGQTWWTNTGYWSYDNRARSIAESWEGSGAPHALGEAARARRSTALKAFGQARDLRLVDVERTTEAGLRIRRQIVQASANLWLVLDETEDSMQRPITARWTTFPDVVVERLDRPHSFVLKSTSRPATLQVNFLGAVGVSVSQRSGNTLPFAGWIWSDRGATPTKAFLVSHRRNLDWSALIWSSHDNDRFVKADPRIVWKDAENWSAKVTTASGQLEISRAGNTLQSEDTRLEVQHPPDISRPKVAIQEAYVTLQREFPKFVDVPAYRARVSYLLLLLLLPQTLVYFVVQRRLGRYVPMLVDAVLIAWLSAALWLHLVYFTL